MTSETTETASAITGSEAIARLQEAGDLHVQSGAYEGPLDWDVVMNAAKEDFEADVYRYEQFWYFRDGQRVARCHLALPRREKDSFGPQAMAMAMIPMLAADEVVWIALGHVVSGPRITNLDQIRKAAASVNLPTCEHGMNTLLVVDFHAHTMFMDTFDLHWSDGNHNERVVTIGDRRSLKEIGGFVKLETAPFLFENLYKCFENPKSYTAAHRQGLLAFETAYGNSFHFDEGAVNG